MGALGTGIGLVSFVQRNPPSAKFSPNSRLFSAVVSTKAKTSLPRKECGIAACLNGDNAKKDLDPSLGTSNAEEAKIDIGLPRRSLLVQFTCDACGDRTSRLINRVAYERGTVFLQVMFGNGRNRPRIRVKLEYRGQGIGFRIPELLYREMCLAKITGIPAYS